MSIAIQDELKSPAARGPFAAHQDSGQMRGRATVLQVALTRVHQHPSLRFYRVDCHFDAGILSLRGTLPSYYLKQVAQEAVRGLAGVQQIRNQIQVEACTIRPEEIDG
jgi:osmotically-inducible protein OsmY